MGSRSDHAFFLLLILFCGCASPGGSGDPWRTWHCAGNAYAQRFQIWENGSARTLLVFGHGGDRDTVGVYWIGEGTGALPPVKAVDLRGRLQSVALGSTTHVPYITALGHHRSIRACAHMRQVQDTALARRVREGQVTEIATGDGLDREVLLTLRPGVLFGYPFGKGQAGAIEALGIPTIEVSEYLEEHPLGRAEWLRFFGVLFGEERRADSLFAGIQQRYEALRADSGVVERPTVLFGSMWDGQWWVPPGNSYMARLIADAGGRYVFADRKGDGNIAVDMETMITVGAVADHWGMVADIRHEPSVIDFTNGDQRLNAFNSVRSGQLILANTAHEDFFGQALVEPDQLLACLRELIAPHLVVDHQMEYRPKYFTGMLRTPVTPTIRTVEFTGPQ